MLRRLKDAAAELGPTDDDAAPRTSLNRPTGHRRRLAVVRADLTAVRAAAHRGGGTVNDALLTAVTGALGLALTARGEPVDRLVISVPVSARGAATATGLGNQVGAIPVSLPTGGDVRQRLATIAEIMRSRRTTNPAASAALLGPAFRALAALRLFHWFIDRQRLVNTFVTNVRGPDRHLTFAGARVEEVIPVTTVTGNVSVSFAVLSYAGRMTCTVIADPDHWPDLPVVVAALQDEFDKLTTPSGASPSGRWVE